jgi:signal peptidase I
VTTIKRRPWLAALLSFFVGAGHLYAGFPRRAMMVLGIDIVGGIAALLAMMHLSTRTAIAAFVAFAVWQIWVAVDAWRLARRGADPERAWRGGRLLLGLVAILVVRAIVSDVESRVFLARVGETFRIPSTSMEPTIHRGDFLFARRATQGAIALGALVIFYNPDGEQIIKRIVARGGDTIQMRNGVLFRNGARLSEPYVISDTTRGSADLPSMLWQRGFVVGVTDTTAYTPTLHDWGALVVPPAHFFALGDNRANSVDSRMFGFISDTAITHTPRWVYFSLEEGVGIRWSRIGLSLADR